MATVQNLVRVDGGGIRYWPYLGYGRWGAAIYLDNPPVLPIDFDPGRLFIADIDGDGCSDLSTWTTAMSQCGTTRGVQHR